MQLAFAFVSFVISKNIAHIEKTNMSKLGAMLKIGALAGAVAISAQASAATFEVKPPILATTVSPVLLTCLQVVTSSSSYLRATLVMLTMDA